MKRRLFTFASAISLVVCVGTVTLWARSHWVADEFKWGWTRGVGWAWTPAGSLELGLFRGDCSDEPADFYGFKHGPAPVNRPINTFVFMEIDPPDKLVVWQWGGFAWYSLRSRTNGNLYAEAVAPFWSIMALAGVLPFGWLVLQTRSRARLLAQKRRGLCRTCGYDLRASTGRCSECGTPIPSKVLA